VDGVGRAWAVLSGLDGAPEEGGFRFILRRTPHTDE
jgi:hypothetical protein